MFSRTLPAMSQAVELAKDDTLWDGSSEPNTSALDRCWIGRRVGEHRILRHLASGGMGHVFLAEHVTTRERAAVKVLPTPHMLASVVRFAEEARLLSELAHPHIVRLLDRGEWEDGTPYLTMERVAGTDLESWLIDNGALSPARVLRILRQVAAALDHLHARGIIHRDIKPANIMLDADGGDAVKLIDFGIAVREQGLALMAPRVVGTPAYMAPEQASGAHGSRASDLYALGALALELLTGSPPYTYPSIQRVIAAVSVEPPAMPSSRGVFISGLDAFFARALARDPRRRFRSANELVDALENVLCGCGAPKLVAVQPARSMKARAWRWIRSALSGSSDALARVA